MDRDYENFVARMGSFEDVIDLDTGEIEDAAIKNNVQHSDQNEQIRRNQMWAYNHAGFQSNELMHFGKKGMKWGKRNGGRNILGTKKYTTKDGTKVKDTKRFGTRTVRERYADGGDKTVRSNKDLTTTTKNGANGSYSKVDASKKFGTTITKMSPVQVKNGEIAALQSAVMQMTMKSLMSSR